MDQFNPTNIKASANYTLYQGIDVLTPAHDQWVASVFWNVQTHMHIHTYTDIYVFQKIHRFKLSFKSFNKLIKFCI